MRNIDSYPNILYLLLVLWVLSMSFSKGSINFNYYVNLWNQRIMLLHCYVWFCLYDAGFYSLSFSVKIPSYSVEAVFGNNCNHYCSEGSTMTDSIMVTLDLQDHFTRAVVMRLKLSQLIFVMNRTSFTKGLIWN